MELETFIKGHESNATAKNTTTSGEMSKKRMILNLLIIGLSFLLLCGAFLSISLLQSTINKDDGLGTFGLATAYGSQMLSSMFFPSFAISHLGCKWTVALSMIGYIIYMAANLHGAPYTLYPASIIVGLGAGPLWSAKCIYITEIAVRYAAVTGRAKDASINLFFGVFYMLLQTSGIWGNAISSTVLKIPPQNISDQQLATCGPNFCHSSQYNNTNLEKPNNTKLYILVGSYITAAVLAFLNIVCFLDNITITNVPVDKNKTDNGKLSLSLLGESFRHCWKSTTQKLLIPITMYLGVQRAFFTSDLTQAYIACSAGVWNVGYVMICFAASASVCSFTSGTLIRYVGHEVFFALGAVTHISLHIVLLLWVPTPSTFYALFIVASLWGMGDAIWLTHVTALYGQLFTSNREAAFANYLLWQTLGLAVSFAYSNYFCVDVKLYICIGLLTVGMGGYVCAEVFHRRKHLAKGVVLEIEIKELLTKVT